MAHVISFGRIQLGRLQCILVRIIFYVTPVLSKWFLAEFEQKATMAFYLWAKIC